VLSLLGNGILLLVAYRKRSSLKPAEYFIVNLSISDLGMTVTLFPLAIPSAFAHRNRPHEGGLRVRRPVVGPVLTGRHRRARLAFATEHQNWQIRHRRLVLFTDESRFYLSTCDRRDRLWRHPGECYAACNIIQHDWFGGGSVTVWGGISLEGHTDLYRLDNGTLTAIRYQNEILGPLVRPYAGAVGPGFLLVHNNARPHVARVCRQFLENERIDTIDWPTGSPDLNPIEHLWDIMFRSIRRHQVALQTVQELIDAMVQIWKEIPQDTIRRLIRSMWLFGELICLYYAVCGVLFGLCSLTNLTALSSVCCLKVCFPIYGNKFSSSHAGLMIVGVWCFASVFAVGPLAHWGRYGPEPYGTACCIDWYAPNHDALAMSYIICLFFFCYVVPCTIIFLSYAFILFTVRGSRQAVQQHVSPQTKTANAHSLIVKLSVAVCIGFLSAWTPYTIVSMWAAFSTSLHVPPIAFALAAILAKSSTIYNPVVYLLFKPNFRKSLTNDTAEIRRRICSSPCKGSPLPEEKDQQTSRCNNKDMSNSTRLSNGLPESHGACLHCAESHDQQATPQRTARVLAGSTHSELTVSQMSEKMRADLI
ncbi:hypothetical protein NFI96_028402, partial [Prochilodus magdalenae]